MAHKAQTQLYLTVFEAHDLKAMDLDGFSDPFCKLSCGGYSTKTKVVDKNLNPTWNESFVFDIDKALYEGETLIVQVMDKDGVWDDYIGSVFIHLKDVPTADVSAKDWKGEWYTVLGKDNEIAGVIHIGIAWQARSKATTAKRAVEDGTTKGLKDKIKKLVSKKKNRFVQGGYNLDLTYILEKVIAMGYPSEKVEGIYRNPIKEVQKFFKEFHEGHFKLYNLCAERSYPASKFEDRVAVYPFHDHNAPSFELILNFCKDVDQWLKRHPKNIVAVHCKAGKGRTGVMIACYLLFSGVCKTYQEALDHFGKYRTSNSKGVTIPSQIRYVHFFEIFLKQYYLLGRQFDFKGRPIVITKIRLTHIPDFDVVGGCDPYFKVLRPDGRVLFNYLKTIKQPDNCSKKKQEYYDFIIHIPIAGDIKFAFYDWDRFSKDDKMCHCWIHTSFITDHFEFMKKEIDGAVKDKKCKHFHKDFKIGFWTEAAAQHDVAEALSETELTDDEIDFEDDDPDYM